jgi:hypothetical protein
VAYKRLVLRPDGSQIMQDFTPDEMADKDAQGQAAASAAAYNQLRRLRRYQAVERLKAVATGGGPNAQLAADVLHAQMIEPTDPDPGPPTS